MVIEIVNHEFQSNIRAKVGSLSMIFSFFPLSDFSQRADSLKELPRTISNFDAGVMEPAAALATVAVIRCFEQAL